MKYLFHWGIYSSGRENHVRFLPPLNKLDALIDHFATEQQAACHQNQTAHQHEFGFAAGVDHFAFTRRHRRVAQGGIGHAGVGGKSAVGRRRDRRSHRADVGHGAGVAGATSGAGRASAGLRHSDLRGHDERGQNGDVRDFHRNKRKGLRLTRAPAVCLKRRATSRAGRKMRFMASILYGVGASAPLFPRLSR